MLALAALVSLTGHDSTSAPTLLRVVEENSQIPLSLEWSVSFEGALFHLGIHNLPSSWAPTIVAAALAFAANLSSVGYANVIVDGVRPERMETHSSTLLDAAAR